MKNKFSLWLLLLPFFLFSSCQSINSNRTEMGISPFVIYFSFDDGPNADGDTTERLLDVLKKYQIKAIFCLLGENTARYPDIVKRIYNEGHYIANHGYSDKWAYRMNGDEFRDNLIRGEAAISSALGRELFPKLYRPQGGYYKSRQEKILLKSGYTLVPGNIRIYDAALKGTDRTKAAGKLIKKIERQGGGIILLHDGRDSYLRMERALAKNPTGAFDRSWIPEFVEEIIIVLLSKGYVLNADYFIE